MIDGKGEDIESGRMFSEMCSLNSATRPPLRGQIKPKNPTTLYEQFKQSNSYESKEKDLNNKQLVTKEQAKQLRDQVLKTTRPLNPYFERSTSSSPNSQTSTNSNKYTPNYSMTYLNNDKKNTMRTTPEVRSIPKIRTKLHIEPIKPQQDFMYIDTFEDETPVRGLHDLFQIEVENRRRIARAEQTASDEFPSPSSNYFSDDCSSPKYTSNLPKCDHCQRSINNMIVQAIGKHFHRECFRCVECSKSLDGLPFAVNDEQTYCMEDYKRPSNVYGQIVSVVSISRDYHIDCYRCYSCDLQLTNDEHRRCYPIGDTLLCRQCNFRWQELGGSLSPLTDL